MYQKATLVLSPLSAKVIDLQVVAHQARELANIAVERDPLCMHYVWLSFWDKPLFANSNVEIAHAQRKSLLVAFQDLEALDGMYFLTVKDNFIARGRGHWQSKEAYAIPSVKPDIWICRTLRDLGLSSVKLTGDNPSLKDNARLIAEVVSFAKSSALAELFDRATPEVSFSRKSERWRTRFTHFYLMRMKRPESNSNVEEEIPPTRCPKHNHY